MCKYESKCELAAFALQATGSYFVGDATGLVLRSSSKQWDQFSGQGHHV